jgi:thiamine pyrophosphokinase
MLKLKKKRIPVRSAHGAHELMRDGWAVVYTGGEAPPLSVVKSFVTGAIKTVAADSGLDLAASYRIVPDVVVGDMDSLINPSLLSGFDPTRLHRYSHEKDETDTEIALRTLREDGFERIVVIGGGGGRLDHLMAILALFDRDARPLLWITESSFVYSVDSTVRVRDRIGVSVSFFPVGSKPCRMESGGLRWELSGLKWNRGDHGVSNVITKGVMSIVMKSGRLLMVGGFDLLTGVEM